MTLLTWFFSDDVLMVEAAVSVLFWGQDNNVFVYTLSPISLKSCLSTNSRRIKCTLSLPPSSVASHQSAVFFSSPCSEDLQ